jgi:hypothetical protein
MGGLVARRFILDNPNLVEHLVTFGTPFLGAPKMLNVLVTGAFFDDSVKSTFILTHEDTKILAEFFSGVHELMPSDWYYELARQSDVPLPAQEGTWDFNGDARTFQVYSYPNLVEAFDRNFRGRPGTNGLTFHGRVGTSPDRLQALPGVKVDVTGERSVSVLLPTSRPFRVRLIASEQPMALAAHTVATGTVTSVVRYNDLDLPAGTLTELTIQPGTSPELRYDANGDGVLETRVPPTVLLAGSAAADHDGPSLSFREARRVGAGLLWVEATDPAGVRGTAYSLNGTEFFPYRGPIIFDPGRVMRILVFADDTLGNRTSVQYLVADALEPDTDLDGTTDSLDNCPTIPNVDQKDTNGNGIGDACALRSVLECVTHKKGNSYVAAFGYENPERVPRSLPVGPTNAFHPTPPNRGQPTSFEPGRHRNVFAVEFDGRDLNTVAWILDGATAIASKKSERCQQAPSR